jgi:hypothetical protein
MAQAIDEFLAGLRPLPDRGSVASWVARIFPDRVSLERRAREMGDDRLLLRALRAGGDLAPNAPTPPAGVKARSAPETTPVPPPPPMAAVHSPEPFPAAMEDRHGRYDGVTRGRDAARARIRSEIQGLFGPRKRS